MTSHMEAARLEQFLVHILTPVYRLTEDDTIRDSQMGKIFISNLKLVGVAYEVSRGTKGDCH